MQANFQSDTRYHANPPAISVADPSNGFNMDPDPTFCLNADPDPDSDARSQTNAYRYPCGSVRRHKSWILTLKNLLYRLLVICRRSHFERNGIRFIHYSLILVNILAPWSGSRRAKSMRIHADLDPKHCRQQMIV